MASTAKYAALSLIISSSTTYATTPMKINRKTATTNMVFELLKKDEMRKAMQIRQQPYIQMRTPKCSIEVLTMIENNLAQTVTTKHDAVITAA